MSEEKENKQTKYDVIMRRVFMFLSILLICVLIFKHCQKTNATQPITAESIIQIREAIVKDSIKEKERQQRQHGHEANVIHDSIVVHVHHYHTLYDTLYKEADSTCRIALFKLNKASVYNDSLYNAELAKLAMELRDAEFIKGSYKDLLSMDSLTHLFDMQQFQEAKKAARKAKLKAFLWGLGIGAATVEAVNVANKLKG